MFRHTKELTGKMPKTFISDGANNFHDAYRTEFSHPYGEVESPVHIMEIRLAGEVNNKMERC